MTTLEALEKLDELFSTPKHFCQENYAEDEYGVGVQPDSPTAQKFCIYGGVYHVTGEARTTRSAVTRALGYAAYEKYNTSGLIGLNDDGSKDEAYTRIRNIIKEAINKCRNT